MSGGVVGKLSGILQVKRKTRDLAGKVTVTSLPPSAMHCGGRGWGGTFHGGGGTFRGG